MSRPATILPPPPIESIPALFAVLTPRASEVREVDTTAWERRETDVDELYSSRIKTGLVALLKPVGDTVPKSGRVVFASPTVDAATGGRTVKVAFDEPVDLPVGLTVNANIVVAETASALTVPRGAIVTEGTLSHVLVVEGGTAVRREVRFSDWPADRVIVTEGLSEGDMVILDPGSVEVGADVVAG